MNDTIVLGAVAYDPKVVTIWEGFKRYFTRHDLAFDYILFSNYERQVEALLDGRIHVAWNSPLAWIRAQRIAEDRGALVSAFCMRDTDRDNHSVVVVRADARIDHLDDLRGRTVAVGAVDSPQATLIPLDHIRRAGLLPGVDFTVQRHEVLSGLHGDHVGGERDAATALITGSADAACMHEWNYRSFVGDGLFPPLQTVVLARTAAFDHCNMTAGPAATQDSIVRLHHSLVTMDPSDAEVTRLFELEGLNQWLDARVEGYAPLAAAVDAFGFYDERGRILHEEYAS